MDIRSKAWEKQERPKKILAIRLQAMGDTIITLPYLQALKKSLPSTTRLDFLTREEVAAIPESLLLFNNVYAIKGARNFKKQFLFACMLLPKLLLNNYDVVIDLQNNPISRLVRNILRPKAWAEFDRFSPIPAGERTRMTIEHIGLGSNFIDINFIFKQSPDIDQLLRDNGWDGKSKLVIINPAGAFVTRNWSLSNYISFTKAWKERLPNTQFVIVGVPFIADKAHYLKEALGDNLLDIVNKTSPVQAFAIVQKALFVLSEDSGLMHMAWVSGVPTVAMFGATRSDWSRPLGKHTLLLSSDDLPCGNCMLENCKYGDTHCLSRYTPSVVLEKSIALLQQLGQYVD